MKYFAATAALVALVPSVLALTINTPIGVVQCQPTLLTFEGGSPPYYLTIIPGGQASAAPLKSFPPQSGSSVTWVSDIAQGTSVTFALKDSTGLTAFTDSVMIQTSSDKRYRTALPDEKICS
ncbi:hypothetical protein NLJ89_g12177 [Agrocybe chaxingu]|uniref:Secreted protein n=1 Tax=Agrocybe chaxingu TaxID=84603 RepID=A0A9W8MNR0_9AGAR|nr:hypothetical protein NLJ89_g12177 [Agrocybe chaxingu]